MSFFLWGVVLVWVGGSVFWDVLFVLFVLFCCVLFGFLFCFVLNRVFLVLFLSFPFFFVFFPVSFSFSKPHKL